MASFLNLLPRSVAVEIRERGQAVIINSLLGRTKPPMKPGSYLLSDFVDSVGVLTFNHYARHHLGT